MPGFQTLFDPSQENLEMRVAEAEAYQKILEQQIKVCIALNVTILNTYHLYYYPLSPCIIIEILLTGLHTFC